MDFEKRRHPRAQIVWPVTLIGLDGLVMGVTRNLSLAGTLVYCSEMPDTNENLSLVLKPAACQTILVTAERVWFNTLVSNNAKIYAMGVCLTHIPDRGRQFLSKTICDHLRLEYIKQFFRRRLRLWRLAILDNMKLYKLKCHRCKTDLLLGPAEEICPVCENPLPKSMDLGRKHMLDKVN